MPSAEAVEFGHHLRWTWDVQRAIRPRSRSCSAPREDEHAVVVRHMVPTDHEISGAELRGLLVPYPRKPAPPSVAGRDVVRCDFAAIRDGDISHSLLIDGSPDDVFGALILPDQLDRWIASSAMVEPVVGGRYELGWEQGGPVKILELVPTRASAILWPESPKRSSPGRSESWRARPA